MDFPSYFMPERQGTFFFRGDVMDNGRIRFHGHTGEEPEHQFRDGDELTASETYGGKSGVVTATQGRSYVMVQHTDGSEGIYHFSDLVPTEEACGKLGIEQGVWSAGEVKAALDYLGFGRRKAQEMYERLELAPQVKAYLMSGVISSRVDLENVIASIESKTPVVSKLGI